MSDSRGQFLPDSIAHLDDFLINVQVRLPSVHTKSLQSRHCVCRYQVRSLIIIPIHCRPTHRCRVKRVVGFRLDSLLSCCWRSTGFICLLTNVELTFQARHACSSTSGIQHTSQRIATYTNSVSLCRCKVRYRSLRCIISHVKGV
jgi:hypothetical protein